jgi:carbon monoxide dehydrogenase subunit G
MTMTEHIAAPPAVVWAFISDLSRIPEWVLGTKKMVWISTAEAELGTEYRELTQIGPSIAETAWRITTFRTPHVQTHESHSALGSMTLTMTVEPHDQGTRLVYQGQYQLLPRVRPLGRLLELLIHRKTTADMQQSLHGARRIIEREYSAGKRTQFKPQPIAS